MADKLSVDTRGVCLFECKGCGMLHAVYPRGCTADYPARWDWNGSKRHPTFSPSILVRWTEHGQEQVCHSFIRDGQIEYLADSTHGLAGRTVPMDDWDLD